MAQIRLPCHPLGGEHPVPELSFGRAGRARTDDDSVAGSARVLDPLRVAGDMDVLGVVKVIPKRAIAPRGRGVMVGSRECDG